MADLLFDKNISCDEMKQYPEKIFKNEYGLDLGSGNTSPIDVDYHCEGGLSSLTFLKNIYELAETIRSEGPQHNCSGSSVHAHWRYYHFDLLKAGLAPDLNVKHHKLFKYRSNEEMQSYFRFWAYQSLYNFELHTAFWKAYNQASPILTNYYKNKFKVTEVQAMEYTEYAFRLLVIRAAGSYPSYLSNGKPKVSIIDEMISRPKTSVKELEKIIHTTNENDINQALKTALLYNKEADMIIERARKEFNEEKRIAMYQRFHEILHEEQPYTFMFLFPTHAAVSKRFDNVKVHMRGLKITEWKVRQ